MDTENKFSHGAMDGVENRRAKEGRAWRISFFLLRVMALVLTLAASIVLGVNKQSTVAQIQAVDGLPPLRVPVTAKWHYLSAFVFFVVSNAIACAYAAVSLLLSFSRKKSLVPITIILDLLAVALLFSGNGAALAVGVLGYKGNSHVRWNKVCNVFGRFCNQVAAAIALSLVGSIVFVLLVMLAALRLHKKSK
ncbi:hypothetical protein GH714_018985 [Hevea brasiliensis]|uniref:CASP-like protein n=1 Tax=Hevea brasiliensis TaxID=3981 RepID=A0A6A6MEX0_HEVBR|nr:hypothetical protein GH714_018985 [Hevea brasiliensis]